MEGMERRSEMGREDSGGRGDDDVSSEEGLDELVVRESGEKDARVSGGTERRAPSTF
jgi:hypothetical protein